MSISEEDIYKEKKILNKVSKLLDDTVEELNCKIDNSYEDLKKFKKLVWQDFTSFDEGDLVNARIETGKEEEKQREKEKYCKRLLSIKKKPYFASIVFKDNLTNKINNIYISLTYLNDKNYNNILYDWRSPICSLFYDYEVGPCSYNSPEGLITGELKRKRQYKIEDKKLIGVFDNSLNIDDEVLQTVLATDSSNEKMKNVVNTIQQEQNQVIRNLEDNTLIVEGIAGSGKTTVALHRIAFLLYRMKDLKSNNILIFSPNNIFSEYISDVLPSLGEKNTLETTFSDYLSFFLTEYREVESFNSFIKRYYTYQEDYKELVIYKQSDEIINDLDHYLEDYINSCKFTDGIIEGQGHKVYVEDLNEMLLYKYNKLPLFERLTEIANKLSETFYNGSLKKSKVFLKLLKENINFKKDYKDIYKNFFNSSYTRIKLPEEFLRRTINRNKIHYEDALIFAYIKGTLEGFKYESNIKQVVIDEAQDYNKLEYIIINKIFRKASFTILGDVNQNINPYYRYKTLKELVPLFNGNTKYIELLKTYRSSKDIVEYTNKILNINHVNAIRKDNSKPVIIRKNIYDLKSILINDINYLTSNYKSTAVIAKDDYEAEKLYNMIKDEVNISLVNMNTENIFTKDLIIIPAYTAKGLEFDSVIIYNNRENSYKGNERNLLYVACTRCQHELIIYN